MSYIYYKFKSSLEYDAIRFDGLHMTLNELREKILQQKKMTTGNYTLQILNAQTKEEYKEEATLIPKNTSVVVARIPINPQLKKTLEKLKRNAIVTEPLITISRNNTFYQDYSNITQNSNLAKLDLTEEDKVKAMINQATKDFDPNLYQNLKYRYPPPSTYVCYKCHQAGHWIHLCPIVTDNNFDSRIKRSTGIPKSFMTTVEGPKIKGALLTNDGKFAIPLIDKHAYTQKKVELPPFLPVKTNESQMPSNPPFTGAAIPKNLQCGLCSGLLQNPTLVPCCANSFCYNCITKALSENTDHICPSCHECDINLKSLLPNKKLQVDVEKFLQKNLPKLPSTNLTKNQSEFLPLVTLTPSNNPIPKFIDAKTPIDTANKLSTSTGFASLPRLTSLPQAFYPHQYNPQPLISSSTATSLASFYPYGPPPVSSISLYQNNINNPNIQALNMLARPPHFYPPPILYPPPPTLLLPPPPTLSAPLLPLIAAPSTANSTNSEVPTIIVTTTSLSADTNKDKNPENLINSPPYQHSTGEKRSRDAEPQHFDHENPKRLSKTNICIANTLFLFHTVQFLTFMF